MIRENLKKRNRPVGEDLVSAQDHRNNSLNNVGVAWHATQKGITLITLVITIIVLLILAGVTINLIMGDSGIFNLAHKAGNNYINASKKEEYDLANLNNLIKENNLDNSNVNNSANRTNYTDYTKNLLYKLDFSNIKNNENGVTISDSGVTIEPQDAYATFNGTGNIKVDSMKIDPENKLGGTTDKTICCWYRTNNIDAAEHVIAAYGLESRGQSCGLYFYLSKIGTFVGHGQCDRMIDPIDMADGQWHFIVGTWSGGNKVRTYFDGVAFEGNGAYSTSNNSDNVGLSVGKNSSGIAGFTGDITDIRIYTESLTTERVQQMYFYGLNKLKGK